MVESAKPSISKGEAKTAVVVLSAKPSLKEQPGTKNPIEPPVNTEPNKNVDESSSSSDKSHGGVLHAVVSIIGETDQMNYAYLFAIMPRFIPINDWNKDVVDDRVINIYESSGERPNITSKDNFDWLEFGKHYVVSEMAATKVYQSRFTFINGFVPSH